MLTNYGVMVSFLIYVRSGIIQKLDSGHMVCSSSIFVNKNFFILQKL